MRWSGSNMGRFGQELVFRPRTGLLVCALWAALTVLWLVMEARDGVGAVVVRLPLIAAVGLLVVALFGRPCVIVDARGITLRNVVRNVRVPFSSLEKVTTRYCLVLVDQQGTEHKAWAAPATGRSGGAGDSGPGHPGSASGPDTRTSSRSDAESVARAINRMRFQDRALLPHDGQGQVQIAWASRLLWSVAASVVLAIVMPVVF